MNAPIDAPIDELAPDELPRRVVIATMGGVVSAMLMAALDGTIVGTAMPRVIAELHGFEHYTAVTTVYMLAATAVVPIAGKLGDLFGRKPFLLLGVVVFVIGSALCGAAQTMTQLVIFRGLQGVGGGFSQAMAFTTIADLYPPAQRGRITGVMGGVFGLASVIGPAIGGFLTDGPGWRWCFYVNLPVGAVAAIILWRFFPGRPPRTEAKPSIDYAGAVTMLLGVIPLLLALSWGGREHAWDSPLILGLLGFGAAAAGLFLYIETQTKEPILPLGLFRNRIVWTSSAAATLVSAGMFGTTIFIPLFIQAVIGTSATKSGAVLTPMMFAMIASSITCGQLMTRTGKYKWFAVAGTAVTTVGLFLLSRMDAHTTYATVFGNMIVMGLGLGLTMPVFNLAVQNAVEHRQVGVATSSVQFMRSLGGSIGAAIFGSVLLNFFAPALHEALPADLAAKLPPEALARFENPQLLMNPEATAQLAQSPLAAHLEPILEAVKAALASSLADVFGFGALLVLLSVGLTLFLRDIPLRKTNAVRAAPPVE